MMDVYAPGMNREQIEMNILRKAAFQLGANQQVEPIYAGWWDINDISVYCDHQIEVPSQVTNPMLSPALHHTILRLDKTYTFYFYGYKYAIKIGVCPDCGALHWARYGDNYID